MRPKRPSSPHSSLPLPPFLPLLPSHHTSTTTGKTSTTIENPIAATEISIAATGKTGTTLVPTPAATGGTLSVRHFFVTLCPKIQEEVDTIQVDDRQFALSLGRDEIQRRVAEVAARMSRDLAGRRPLLLVVLNGAFMFAADLVRGLSEPCEISFVRLASYAGTQSTGQVRQLIGLNEPVEGRTVVVVEDIVDSGRTMEQLLATLRAMRPAEVRIASLFVKPGKLKADLDIAYRCFDIPDDFIVGYGLDYNGYGRNLPDIYTVVGTH